MILSAADIKGTLSRDVLLRFVSEIKIVDGKPPITGGTGVVICIDRYPSVDEFEATWKIWIIDYDDDPIDVYIQQIQRLLPRVELLSNSAIAELQTTSLRSVDTQLRPKDAPEVLPLAGFHVIEQRFQDLVDEINDKMLLVGPGRPGRDGRDGIDGKDGINGRDLKATEVKLEDLSDVEASDAKVGQVLIWDGGSWAAKFLPQVYNYAQGGSGGGGIPEAPDDGEQYARKNGSWEIVQLDGSGIPEPPSDGRYYVRANGEWVDLLTAIQSLQLDSGDFGGT